MTDSGSVSVVIPAYNAAPYLGDALESALGQTLAPHEVIVIDDGSDDDTRSVAESHHGVIYVRQQHQGPAQARNHGVELSTGEYLAFLDADDLYAPGKLEVQLDALRASSPPDLIFGKVVQFRSPELGDEAGDPPSPEPVDGIHPGAMLVSRDCFDQVGAFDQDVGFADFIDWFARAQERGLRMPVLDDVVMYRRIHLTNFGRTHENRHDYARVLRHVLDRRRPQA